MTNCPTTTIPCLDKGFIRLVDVMPRLVPDGQTADSAIVQAARVSYGDGTKTVNEDRGLIRYLMRHAHTTPTEMVEFKFCCRMPIFVCRQWARHRMSSTNEVSARYSIVKDDFYLPETKNIRQQSKTNKQGGDQEVDLGTAENFLAYLNELTEETYAKYAAEIEKGVSREQARMMLPINLYTEFFWKIDLHNLLHFLALRCDSHAQWEIRVFADAILELIKPIVPWSIEAWNDYHPMRGAVKLTRLEIEALKQYLGMVIQGCPEEYKVVPKINSDNKREQAEWTEKLKLFGLKNE
jgi:thymidylate synthase (FAD)